MNEAWIGWRVSLLRDERKHDWFSCLPHPSRILARHIRDLLGQQTALVPIAQSLLQRINERAIDERLRDAAAELGALQTVAGDGTGE